MARFVASVASMLWVCAAVRKQNEAGLETEETQSAVNPCDDLSRIDEEKYNFTCPVGQTCEFWDACPPLKNGGCPGGCEVYNDALGLTGQTIKYSQRPNASRQHQFDVQPAQGVF